MSLNSLQSGPAKENKQNLRILEQLIQESKQFDMNLKKMGIDINIAEILGGGKSSTGKDGHKTGDNTDSENGNSEDDDSDTEKIDVANIGKIMIDASDYKYLPQLQKGEFLTHKNYSQYMIQPKAPNKRLDIKPVAQELSCITMDLYDLLVRLYLIKKKPLYEKDGSSIKRHIPKALLLKLVTGMVKVKIYKQFDQD